MLVLIVDDEPVVAKTLGLIFERSGFTAKVVGSAAEALVLVRQTPPDLIVCDIEMPVRDGLALMGDLATELPCCPILVLTGAYRSLNLIRATAEALQRQFAILTKPCQPTHLLQAASTLLRAEDKPDSALS